MTNNKAETTALTGDNMTWKQPRELVCMDYVDQVSPTQRIVEGCVCSPVLL